LRRTLQTAAIEIACEITDTNNTRLHRLHDLRDATRDLRFNLVLDLLEGHRQAACADMPRAVAEELKQTEAFIDGVVACDVALALKQ